MQQFANTGVPRRLDRHREHRRSARNGWGCAPLGRDAVHRVNCRSFAGQFSRIGGKSMIDKDFSSCTRNLWTTLWGNCGQRGQVLDSAGLRCLCLFSQQCCSA
jgi:hypothetical protein